MNLKAQTVYLPVQVSERLPVFNECVFTDNGVASFDGDDWEDSQYRLCRPEFWLEKRTAIVSTEEELQQKKDKFAVEFFNWVKSNFYEFYDDDNFFEFKGYQRKILKGKAFHIYELLDIYKEELVNKK